MATSWSAPRRAGFVTGLQAEARLARRLGAVAAGGGWPAGAATAAERLVREGATALVSFGLCGGLDPALRPGNLIVAETVLERNQRYATDAALSAALGGWSAAVLLAGDQPLDDPHDKRACHAATGAAAIDLESGAVARVAATHGLPFAVLRAVCDPAGARLPPAALVALDARGAIAVRGVLLSVLRGPRQIPELIALGRAAAAARAALVARVDGICRRTGGGRLVA